MSINTSQNKIPLKSNTYGIIDPYEADKINEQEARRSLLLNQVAQRELYSRPKTYKTKELPPTGGLGNYGLISEKNSEKNNAKPCQTRDKVKLKRRKKTYKKEKYYDPTETTLWLKYNRKYDLITQFDLDYADLIKKETKISRNIQFTKTQLALNELYRDLSDAYGLGGSSKCLTGVLVKNVHIPVVNDNSKIQFKGLLKCGSIHCPHCSKYQEMDNAKLLSNAIKYHLEVNSGSVFTCVLTYRHKLSKHLDPYDTAERFSKAVSDFTSHIRDYERKVGCEFVDFHKKIESTGSRLNSWHDHLNFTLFISKGENFSVRKLENLLFDLWCKSLKENGLSCPDSKRGMNMNEISNESEIEGYSSYIFKNSSNFILNSALEMAKSSSKVGAVKSKVRRWQPFELLLESLKYRELDEGRSKFFADLYVENVKRWFGKKMSIWGKRGLVKKANEYYSNKVKDNDDEVSIDKDTVKAFVRNEVYKITLKEKLLPLVLDICLNDKASSQVKTSAIDNVYLVSAFNEILRERKVCFSFSIAEYLHYVKQNLNDCSCVDLMSYLKDKAIDSICVDDFKDSIYFDYEPIIFSEYLNAYDSVVEQEKMRVKVKAKMRGLKARINYLEEKIRLSKYFNKSGLLKRDLTNRENKRFKRELHRNYETTCFCSLLSLNVKPVDFILSLKGKTELELRNLSKEYFVRFNVIKHWQNVPKSFVLCKYKKWQKKLTTAFDLEQMECDLSVYKEELSNLIEENLEYLDHQEFSDYSKSLEIFM